MTIACIELLIIPDRTSRGEYVEKAGLRVNQCLIFVMNLRVLSSDEF